MLPFILVFLEDNYSNIKHYLMSNKIANTYSKEYVYWQDRDRIRIYFDTSSTYFYLVACTEDSIIIDNRNCLTNRGLNGEFLLEYPFTQIPEDLKNVGYSNSFLNDFNHKEIIKIVNESLFERIKNKKMKTVKECFISNTNSTI